MQNSPLELFIEINDQNFIISVVSNNENNNFKILNKSVSPLYGIKNNRIIDLEKFFNSIKENVYLIEQKLNHTFKEVVLILDNFNHAFISLTGFKKLNGTQVTRENITYILNMLKAHIEEKETNKNILHIFNSKFELDSKKIENLPIGLFGDLYSHELSFTLINLNDYKNLKEVFNKCNLKIKKVLSKSFIKGVHLSEENKNIETFFQIKTNNDNSKIFFFENNSLKYEQNFKFGIDIIEKDISKITCLKVSTVKKILGKVQFTKDFPKDELIEEEFFIDDTYRKIKKGLVYDIASARIQEILDLILFKNINFQYFRKHTKIIFFELNDKIKSQSLQNLYKNIFLLSGNIDLRFLDNSSSENTIKTANKIIHYGWKKEAIPVARTHKTLLGKIFDGIFG